MSFLLTEINRIREENTYLRWKLDHPNSLAEKIPVVKVGEDEEPSQVGDVIGALSRLDRRISHLETLIKGNGS